MSPLGRAILEPVSSDWVCCGLVALLPLIGCMALVVSSQAHLGNRPDIAALLGEEEERQAAVKGTRKE